MRTSATLLLSLASLAASAVFAQETATPEQITVTGQKTATELRAEAQQLEQDMYTLYSSLNTNNDFDVACGNFIPTGSKLPIWKCEAAFIRDAQGRETQHGEFDKKMDLTPAQIERKYRKQIDELNADMMAIAHQNTDLAKAMITLNAKQQELAALEGNGKRSRSSKGDRTSR